jgi:peptidase M23-like protein
MPHIPKSEFVSHLIRINKFDACGFDRFVFFHGMMFGSEKKWWGKKGLRGSTHEGLDLCFFQSRQKKNFRMDETTDVPMIYDGRVEHITKDLLGKTVITRHCFKDPGQSEILSLYGHLNPDKNLKVGDKLIEGQVFAKIAGFGNQKKILQPHVHISLVKPDLLPPAESLEWEFLNTVDRDVFIDPLDAISPQYTVIEYDDGMDVSKIFARCSQLNTIS